MKPYIKTPPIQTKAMENKQWTIHKDTAYTNESHGDQTMKPYMKTPPIQTKPWRTNNEPYIKTPPIITVEVNLPGAAESCTYIEHLRNASLLRVLSIGKYGFRFWNPTKSIWKEDFCPSKSENGFRVLLWNSKSGFWSRNPDFPIESTLNVNASLKVTSLTCIRNDIQVYIPSAKHEISKRPNRIDRPT